MSKEDITRWANTCMDFVYNDLGYKKEQVYDVLMWIIIRYIAIDKRISWQDYLDNLKENREKEKSSM